MQPAKLFGQAHGGVPRRSSSALPEWLMTEVTKASDGSLLGDLGHTPLSKKEGVKWQRPRLSRQALMRCCLVKWILSSTAPQGSGHLQDTHFSELSEDTAEAEILASSVPDGNSPRHPWALGSSSNKEMLMFRDLHRSPARM
ncbi:calsenilin isoform X5 [Macaca fascicularis]|uniref:calsenilin isoform X5 n=1 Tax=Macaca fascicularis TaxID=9541 RepID=UPI003D15B31F